ncbi:MAG: TonB-dependent receptor [Bacteroidetes bacterium]|nr:TonB-dependent receptor [Bacteroidota bacterium]
MFRNIILLLAFALPVFVFSQNSVVTGKLVDDAGNALEGIQVFFTHEQNVFSTHTDADGKFTLEVPYGTYQAKYSTNDNSFEKETAVTNEATALGDIKYEGVTGETNPTTSDNLPTITLSEDDTKDDGSQNVSSVLGASRDPFISAASFTFSQARFRVRGYEGDEFETYLNGIPVNDLERGNTPTNEWAGLNDVFRNRDLSFGLSPVTFAFGGVGGVQSLDTRAATQRKQLQVSYATANRNYRHRVMATYSTGILAHGWAVSVSASRRWAKEGYVPGTFYDGYSYFLAVQKYFGSNQSLNLTILGSPTASSGASAATMESFDLAGSHYYNPNWGYDHGIKRNVHTRTSNIPNFILTHDYKFNNHESMITAVGFAFGQRGYTSIDWNNAPDPRPDYYKYLPSYIEDSTLQAVSQRAFREKEYMRQVNWNKFYEANDMSHETIDSADGFAGNTITGKRARYIVENRIQDIKKLDFATTYNNAINSHVAVSTGLTYQFVINNFYKRVEDLLGADFYVDVNQFAVRDFPDSFSIGQNDLLHPNHILYTGDKFGYNYLVNVHHASAWLQSVFTYNKLDFFVAAQLSYTGFWREGKMVNGLFPTRSFGKSEVQNFINYGIKGGVTYKANGRNYLYVNGAYETYAPYFENAYVSPRGRNTVVDNLKSESVYSVEAGYKLVMPNVKLKLTGYFTQFVNKTTNTTFYHDDYRSFVNYTMTGINQRHWGIELGLEAKIYKGFSATAAASFGRYTYSSRPSLTITQDNTASVIAQNEKVYLKNFNIAGTPQLATTVGINYRSPQFWFAGVNFNYYDWMWLAVNPARRTAQGIDLLEPGTANWDNTIDQQRLKGQFTMDFHAGYSWLLNNNFKNLKKRYFLVFNATISNISNNKNFITGGFEQQRFDYKNNVVDKFPSKYSYAPGASYYFSVAFRMN